MNGTESRPDPSPPHKVVKKGVGDHEFTAGFYPGFARSITVNGVNVYNQKEDGPFPFVLPSGEDKPWHSSVIDLSSTKGYHLVLHLDDPDHVVERVVLHLRHPDSNDAVARSVAAFQGGDGDEVAIDETPVICPPFCALTPP